MKDFNSNYNRWNFHFCRLLVLGSAVLITGCATHHSDSSAQSPPKKQSQDQGRLGVQVKGDYEHMFISGEGHKEWYSALELEQIATQFAQSKKLNFVFDGTEANVWVHTDGGKVLAEVWFSSGVGKPSLQVMINRKGEALNYKLYNMPGQ